MAALRSLTGEERRTLRRLVDARVRQLVPYENGRFEPRLYPRRAETLVDDLAPRQRGYDAATIAAALEDLA